MRNAIALVVGLLILTVRVSIAQGIIADRTVVSQFEQIPLTYIEAARAKKVLFMHQSVGDNIWNLGLGCLSGDHNDPEHYPAECIKYVASTPYDRSNWTWPVWYTQFGGPQSDALAKMDQFVDTVNALVTPGSSPYNVVGMKFCYVDGWNQGWYYDPQWWPTPPSHGYRYHYRQHMEDLERANPGKQFIWATSSLWVENHVNLPDIRAFNEGVRAYAAANGKLLYDIADIMSHDSNGNPCTQNGVESMCPEYSIWLPNNDSHPNVAASIKLAKAFWWLMARASGWNGAAGDSQTMQFSHVALGGGWTTSITLANTAATSSQGVLSFVGQDGKALQVRVNGSLVSSVAVSVPSGGARTFAITPADSGGAVRSGWAKLSYTGGRLGGYSTFQFAENGLLRTIAGVFPSELVSSAVIPIDNNAGLSRFTGFAVANPNSENISITVKILDAAGTTVETITPAELNPLSAGGQAARFIHEYVSGRSTFKGSAVLSAAGGEDFAAAALLQNETQYTSIPVLSQPAGSNASLFGHVAVGGGYSTSFTLLNTGASNLSGSLVLTGSDGGAWNTSLKTGDQAAITGSRAAFSIAPGGVQFITASPPLGTDPVRTGWAGIEGGGTTIGGVATYRWENNGVFQGAVGVLSAQVAQAVTIPADDDVNANRYTGYAVANPGDSTITIRVIAVSEGGTATELTPVILRAKEQKAAFFWQDPKASGTFKGTVILTGQGGASFSAVSLLLNQGLYAAIPVISGKAPQFGN